MKCDLDSKKLTKPAFQWISEKNTVLQTKDAFFSPALLSGSMQHLTIIILTRAQLFKTNDVVSEQFVKIYIEWYANMLKFFAEKMWVAFAVQKLLTFFQQNISEYCILNLLKQLTKLPLTSSLS